LQFPVQAKITAAYSLAYRWSASGSPADVDSVRHVYDEVHEMCFRPCAVTYTECRCLQFVATVSRELGKMDSSGLTPEVVAALSLPELQARLASIEAKFVDKVL